MFQDAQATAASSTFQYAQQCEMDPCLISQAGNIMLDVPAQEEEEKDPGFFGRQDVASCSSAGKKKKKKGAKAHILVEDPVSGAVIGGGSVVQAKTVNPLIRCGSAPAAWPLLDLTEPDDDWLLGLDTLPFLDLSDKEARCPSCGAALVLPGDFCGQCGHRFPYGIHEADKQLVHTDGTLSPPMFGGYHKQAPKTW